MSGEILVNVNPQETRVALLNSGVLQELIVQRTDQQGLVGNIYMGRVSRVLPGMQAAFVDIGLERTAFLHVSDIVPHLKGQYQRGQPQSGKNQTHANGQGQKNAPSQSVTNDDTEVPQIQSLLHEGQKILVQILKDPMGSKGARLTTQISVPSRYLVLLPDGDDAGVSVRIEDEDERERLKEIVRLIMSDPEQGAATQQGQSSGITGGYIVRTAGEGVDAESLRADMQFLNNLWDWIQTQSRSMEPGDLVHGDLPLVMRILRDMIGTPVDRVRIDSVEDCQRVVRFAERFIPHMAGRIEHYDGKGPIFDLYGVEEELQRALQRKVSLKSGGYLVIDQTEALTSIDVNTGGFVGHRNLEETIFKTNLEATQVIARQLRLRNLGGIIICDFIDMGLEEHRNLVLQALLDALADDPAKTQVGEFSNLGLVEMTRKRTRESLEHILCEPCPTCDGRGSIKTIETVCFDIFREVQRSAVQFQAKALLVLAAPDVVAMLLDEQSSSLADLESQVGRPIRLQSEQLYAQEEYDVVLV